MTALCLMAASGMAQTDEIRDRGALRLSVTHASAVVAGRQHGGERLGAFVPAPLSPVIAPPSRGVDEMCEALAPSGELDRPVPVSRGPPRH